MNNISIILVSYFTGEVLFESIQSILQNTDVNKELIIINNGNPMEILARLELLQKEGMIKLISGQGNVGFSKACNIGAKESSFNHLLFLNPDSIVIDNAISSLNDKFLELNSKGILSGFVCNLDKSEQRGLRRNILTPMSLFIEMFHLDKIFKSLEVKKFNLTGQKIKSSLIEVGAVSGSCILINKQFFNKINGFCEDYFLHVEDIDICRKTIISGEKVRIFTKSFFIHYKSTSDISSNLVEFYKKNGFYIYFKKYHKFFWYSPLGVGLRFFIELKYFTSNIKGKKK